MDYTSIDDLKKHQFEGFDPISKIRQNLSLIPDYMGVYLIISASPAGIKFLITGTGGFFKGKDPNVPVSLLEKIHLKNSIVLYIGKAGGSKSGSTLRKRLKQYFDFGVGKNVGHWGGRYIWQIKDSENLLVGWKATPDIEPREAEKQLIKGYINQFGRKPFANLAG